MKNFLINDEINEEIIACAFDISYCRNNSLSFFAVPFSTFYFTKSWLYQPELTLNPELSPSFSWGLAMITPESTPSIWLVQLAMRSKKNNKLPGT